jgi:hypothetical protein
MLSPDECHQALPSLFRRQGIADLNTLFTVLETHSRMSVFRRLSDIGYFSSYSHAGRYYTLRDIPQFDHDGLWRYQGVGFSRYGSLKSTVEHLVEEAEAGRTHYELYVRLQVRVHNTLLELVRAKRIGREPFAGQYLYVSADSARAHGQLSLRGRQQEGAATAQLPSSVVIEVLLELVQGARIQPDAERVATRLATRGLAVTTEQVEAVFARYELKKTVRSRSRR